MHAAQVGQGVACPSPRPGRARFQRRSATKGPDQLDQAERSRTLQDAVERAEGAEACKGEDEPGAAFFRCLGHQHAGDRHEAEGAQNVHPVLRSRRKKRGSITKMEPYESGGKQAREEDTPFAIWTLPREEIRLDPVSGEERPREEGSVCVSATICICSRAGLSAMRQEACQPCTLCREGQAG